MLGGEPSYEVHEHDRQDAYPTRQDDAEVGVAHRSPGEGAQGLRRTGDLVGSGRISVIEEHLERLCEPFFFREKGIVAFPDLAALHCH